MATRLEDGRAINRDYGHTFELLMPNVEGACIHCSVRLGMLSEVKGWDGKDQYRVWLYPDGSWSKFGARSRSAPGSTSIPPCTHEHVPDEARSEAARLRFGKGITEVKPKVVRTPIAPRREAPVTAKVPKKAAVIFYTLPGDDDDE